MIDIKQKLKSKYVTAQDVLSFYSLEEVIEFVNNVDGYKDDIQDDKNFSENYFRLLSHILLVAYIKKSKIELSPLVHEFIRTC